MCASSTTLCSFTKVLQKRRVEAVALLAKKLKVRLKSYQSANDKNGLEMLERFWSPPLCEMYGYHCTLFCCCCWCLFYFLCILCLVTMPNCLYLRVTTVYKYPTAVLHPGFESGIFAAYYVQQTVIPKWVAKSAKKEMAWDLTKKNLGWMHETMYEFVVRLVQSNLKYCQHTVKRYLQQYRSLRDLIEPTRVLHTPFLSILSITQLVCLPTIPYMYYLFTDGVCDTKNWSG